VFSFQHFWNQISPSNKLKAIKDNTLPRNSYNNISRRADIIFTRLRTGHSLLTHSYLLNKDPPPICNICKTQITILHILVHCPKFHKERSALSISNKPIEILEDSHQNIQKILKFLTNTNLKSLL